MTMSETFRFEIVSHDVKTATFIYVCDEILD